MKILITGGHLAPALAVIDEIKKEKPNIKMIFVGRKYAIDKDKVESLEYKEIKKKNIKFINLKTGKLTRIFSLEYFLNFLKIFLGFFNSFFIILNHRPDLILSFGSYLALPIVFWGYIFKIPVFTHEQTINPGLANKIIGLFAKKIFISFKEAEKFFNKNKVILTGNPIRQSIFKIQKKPFFIKKTIPVLYITGGSLGSHSINLHIKKILKNLLESYIVIHQTGDTKEYHDYEDLLSIKNQLPENLKNKYFLAKHFFEDEIAYIYFLSDLVISRSGANTFFELIVLKKPAVFIPLPWSAGKEQQYHAEIFAKAGCGEIFHQIESSDKLLRIINKMIKNISFYKNNFKNLRDLYSKNASKKIIKEIFL
ncbi:MAG: UDP-N-acetylglucosamine--N-acetylmuramyl-(pentapeptide) pyrophosphoryl-undecaprenol N-acetylglucosamine transferase [Patescibacteria group bacterium]|nr:UDP-N-acetylglucosamine--N-acetylmuramyl-(pentapeptide) pyrophosphoryl-undecaprenol N-acetylglucosamine transferase [Patescibacteria group bacterium]